ncbi:hypothetical protein L198_05858 [Cryptococcus wingfieldii CBS 7118]|uniref:Uncharacterized protein n=1 Tax=Cryptococcus wingfieldii CBS 7118 TaxID=1295528 RepID=A0A1E3IRW0_9TREE|nr:hypothetical protein L198_05858 [Cryptococcus wingfieldii CBS 7118]ODN91347.1 hypothetical protein L198_05858 [Cryptococcus wingfieldii CBS 7118]
MSSIPQPVAHPATLSRFPMRVPRWRELVPIIPTAWPGRDDGFHGWLLDLCKDIAGQDGRAYDKWIDIEYKEIDSLELPPEEVNIARSLAKKRLMTTGHF